MIQRIKMILTSLGQLLRGQQASKDTRKKDKQGSKKKPLRVKNALFARIRSWLVNIFYYHIVFYQILEKTKQRWLFVASILVMAVDTAILPTMLNSQRALWIASLTGKSATLFAAGWGFIATVIGLALVSFLVDQMNSYFVVQVTFHLRQSVAKFFGKKNNLMNLQEEECMLRNQQRAGNLEGASASKTFSREVERFLHLFIAFHKYAGLVVYWSVLSLIGIAKIGLLRQGILILCVSILAIVLVMRKCSTSNVYEGKSTASYLYEQIFQNLMEERRIKSFPNFVKVSIDFMKKHAEKVKILGIKESFFDDLSNRLSGAMDRISEPLLILGMFIGPYLTTDMSYKSLQGSLSDLTSLLGVATSALGLVRQVGVLQVLSRQISRLIESLYNKNYDHSPKYFMGLRVEKGAMSFAQSADFTQADKNKGQAKPDRSRVLRFCAEVRLAANVSVDQGKAKGQVNDEVFKQYRMPVSEDSSADTDGSSSQLELTAGEMVLVVGVNGAGKTILLNVLTGLVPGLSMSGSIAEDATFSLYCEQKVMAFPEAGSGRPWSPVQMLYMLWPQLQTTDIESLEDSTELMYHDKSGQESAVTVKDIKHKMNDYLQKLNFDLAIYWQEEGEIKKESLTTVEQLEQYQCCFSDMSGGQQGKLRLAIYFAMAEVLKPRLFLVDEPYNHIDRNGKIAIRKVLKEMQERGILNETTTLVVTHDDHDSRNLPSYDKVLAVLPEVEAIGYYGTINEHGENKYESWLLRRQASSNGEEAGYMDIPECREYMIPT